MKEIKLLLFSIALSLFVGCQTSNDRNFEQNSATSPEIIELKDGDSYDLTAEYVKQEIDGVSYEMLAYNGSIPGPTLKVPQGSEITLNFTNNTDIPTSIHSHGLRLEDKFDGVVDVHQPAIAKGEKFTYKLKFPDVGMFWYHPHLNEPYAQSHGLYGAYWVTPTDKNYWSPVNEEVPLMLNDISIQNGQIESFDSEVTRFALMGQFGNVMLVNGKTDYQKNFNTGEVVRFYIANASNTRIYNLSIPNAKIKLVGGDNGKYEYETWHDNIILSPSERAIIEVFFDESGTYTLQSVNPYATYKLATFTVENGKADQDFTKEFNQLRTNQDVITDIDQFRKDFDKPSDKNIQLSMEMNQGGHIMGGGMMMDHSSDEKIEWEDTMQMMNEMSTTNMVKWQIVDEATEEVNMDINWKFKVGDKVKVKIFNDPKSMHPMQHPIHFHGQRFLVLNTNGVKNENLVWKDTVLVPKGDTVEILVDMSNPGKWMVHCHIAEHLASEMMMGFEVLN
ncbi:MAG: multicopper oxidase family protein [Patescibacteria group bacterium]